MSNTMMSQPVGSLKVASEAYGSAIATHVRQTLPGQQARSTLEVAQAMFGVAMTQEDIDRRIRAGLPRLSWWTRQIEGRQWGLYWDALAQYQAFIPDAALERYAEADASGYFAEFVVISALSQRRSTDPWLVGRVQGTDRWIALAYWD